MTRKPFYRTMSEALLVVLFGVASSGVAHGVSFTYEGVINESRAVVGFGDPAPPATDAAFTALLGETVRYTITFDPTTPDTDPDVTFGNYVNAGTIAVSLAGLAFTSDLDIFVLDDVVNLFLPTTGADGFGVDTINVVGPSVGGTVPTDILFSLLNADAPLPVSPFSSDALPLVAPDPSDFERVLAGVNFEDTGAGIRGAFRTGGVTLVTVPDTINPIPEPTTLTLFGTGAALLFLKRMHNLRRERNS